MTHFDLRELGKLLAKRRKELNKRQTDLADDLISVAYISNIENGKVVPSKEKLEHLCKKLELNMEEIPVLIDEQKQKNKESWDKYLQFELLIAEHMIDSFGTEVGNKEFNNLFIPPEHPQAATWYYLKGKQYLEKGKWKQATPYFSQAIRLVDQHPEMRKSNIAAASHYELSRISYYQNYLQQALDYVEKGLSCYDPNGERKYMKYYLKISQVIYLQKLERIEESLKILEELWKEKHQIPGTEVILNMYETQASLLNKLEMYSEAIRYAHEGLEIARLERNYERELELWTTLGTSYTCLNRTHEAKRCFHLAIQLMDKIKREALLVTTKTQLGLLYMNEGDLHRAEEILEEAVQLGEKTNHTYRLSEALIALGDCYLRLKNFERSLHYLEYALKLAKHHQSLSQQRKILLKIVRCSEKLDPEKYKYFVDEFVKVSVLLDEDRKPQLLNPLSRSEEGNFQVEPPSS